MDPKNLVYDYENNKVIVDGMVFDGPTTMEEIPIVLRRIEEALELRWMVAREAMKGPGKDEGESSGSSSTQGGKAT